MSNLPLQQQPENGHPVLPAGAALPPAIRDLKREEIRLEANSSRGPIALSIALSADLSQPSTAVVAVHGFCSNRATQFSMRTEVHAVSNECLSCRVGLRGQDPESGEKVEQFTLSKGVEDLQVTLDSLRARGASRFVLAANSVGAQLALLVARKVTDVSNLVLFAPLTDAWGAMSSQLDAHGVASKWMAEGVIDFEIGASKTKVKLGAELYRDAKRIRESLDYSSIGADVSVIFAADDKVVPPVVMQKALGSLPKEPEIHLIGGADHGFTCAQAQHLAMKHFDNCLSRAIQGSSTRSLLHRLVDPE